MEDWQERVIEEEKALNEKLKKLKSFFDSIAFNELPVSDSKTLLLEQYKAMVAYWACLKGRIELFKV